MPACPRAVVLFSALLLSAAPSCGGDSGSGMPTANASSCDFRAASTSGSQFCQEYVVDATAVAAYKNACNAVIGAVWASTGCPRTNALGGCTNTTAGITLTTWFYAGGAYASAASIMASCSKDGKSTFVAP